MLQKNSKPAQLITAPAHQLRKLEKHQENLNGSNYFMLEQQGITGWIPVFRVYKPEIAGFPYDKEKDRYVCPISKPLPFKGFDRTADGRLQRNYWAAPQDCRQCASYPTCDLKTRCRKTTRTAYDEQYLRAHARRQSRHGKRMQKLRQSKVEPVFGSLVQHYGLRNINVLGKSGAHKVMLLAAVAFNLRKYMRCKSTKSVSMAMALEKERQQAFEAVLICSLSTKTNEVRVEEYVGSLG